MIHRRVIRMFSAALVAGLVLGCSEDEGPTGTPGPFLVVTPSFQGLDEGATVQLAATLGGNPIAVTWVSANPARASVSATGLVRGLDACAGAPATPVCSSNLVPITATATSDATMTRSASITVQKLQGIGLTSGVPVTGLSSNAGPGSRVLYRIFVPAGSTNLRVQMSGGTGDADLYVRRQTPPTTTTFDCRPFLGGNDELCTFPNPASATWYIMIEEFDPYTGVTITATVN